MSRPSLRGSSGLSAVTADGVSLRMDYSSNAVDPSEKGRCPTASSYNSTPSEKMSEW